MTRAVLIDFEYNQSSEPVLNVVCVAFSYLDSPNDIKTIWLHNDPKAKQEFVSIARSWRKEGVILLSYAVTAEARSFYSLGLNPRQFNWIDLYAEFRQCQHNNNSLLYGTYFKHGFRRHSEPPSYDARQNVGKDNNTVGAGLVDCVGVLFGEYIDSQHKTTMRNLIISNKSEYSEEEQNNILNYCASDLKYLPKIFDKLTEILKKAIIRWYPQWKLNDKDFHKLIRKFQLTRGRYSANVAIMESYGIPMDIQATKNLIANQPLARERLIEKLNESYPFYIRKKKTKADLQGKYVQDYQTLAKFIENHSSINPAKWKKTESGKYESSESCLEAYEGIIELANLRKTNKILGQLKWLQDGFLTNIGSDAHLRTFFGIFGSQTGRNQPQAKRFIFAMSSWLRALIRPPKNHILIELDYSSQEHLLGGIISQDKKLIEAYVSGDPYLAFAKDGGLAPENATKETHPDERRIAKALVLGVGYGMQAQALSIRMSAQMGKTITPEQTQKLLDKHRTVYRKYWAYTEEIEATYRRKKCYVLDDGWSLMMDNDNSLSVKNFPIQGTGAVIIRKAVDLILSQKIKIIATLHDACYIVSSESNYISDLAVAKLCMQQAYKEIASKYIDNPPDIRIDTGIHRWDEPFVVEKGKKMYELLKEYLEDIETPDKLQFRLSETIFSDKEISDEYE